MRGGSWITAGILFGSIVGFSQELPTAQSLHARGFQAGTAPLSSGRSAHSVGMQDAPPEHRPVLLIPGWLGRSADLMALKERLERDGWDGDAVFPFEFQDPAGSSVAHAQELDGFIEEVLVETGASEVDIVAHSMGGLAVWVLLQQKGLALPINRVAFLATPFQGTVTAYLAWGAGGPEMIPESSFLRRLQQGGWPQRWVKSLAIRTPLDLTVVPGYGATPLGIDDVVICCPTHQGLLDHEETYLLVRDFLAGEGVREEGEGSR